MSSSNSSFYGSIRVTLISMGLRVIRSSAGVLNCINFMLKNACDTFLEYKDLKMSIKSFSAFFLYFPTRPISLPDEFPDYLLWST